jgi:hypothetical protein
VKFLLQTPIIATTTRHHHFKKQRQHGKLY